MSIDGCCCCLFDFEDDHKLIVEYQTKKYSKWYLSPYCWECTDMLIKFQWELYVKSIEKADCAASLRRAIQKRPPVNLRIECDEPYIQCEVYQLRLKHNQEIIPCKLVGSLEGDERQKWWDEKKQICKIIEQD